ncbi:biopolymer transporter TolR [Pedobacter sp. HMF7647]|uniref:Biopolymer transporter TolR n=1 Tax=Hufsiella arboris TaxID=2695275 RepID=A0A7K1Y9Z7_9SPHI|nr:PD40 domain-containing protein [Hufsiella arboris]MXV51423.1 biopolymer transporter TolR [Hufsiella arboris]
MKIYIVRICGLLLLICLSLSPVYAQTQSLGIFNGHSDIGNVKHAGSASYNSEAQSYTISGSGTNIWFDHDEFHFVWKKMKGDFILRTNAAFIGKGTELHRKWGWMIRSSLDTNSRHVNAVVHGDGLTSLQFRRKDGATTEEIKSTIKAADVVQLERKGNVYTMSVALKGETFTSEKLEGVDLGDDVYVGLFVCSHNPNIIEKAVFNNVRIVVPAPVELVAYKQYIGSNLEILDIATQNSKVIYQTPGSIQAPNWNKDGKSLIYNADGLLYQFDLKTSKPNIINTGAAKHNNNDHVLSFDGKMLAISSGDGENGTSIGYVVPRTGGEPKRITETGPSYMHGWSPDGKTLVFTGQRNKEFDVYSIPSTGGPEKRLTTAPGLDDGPEYSPDGRYIYFNSVRSGLMQIWRMKRDGSDQTQITDDGFNNWFPHISPDGKSIVFISFLKEEVDPGDHPFYKHVYIRVMPTAGGKPKVIAYLYGGQGTINTPSWSPDSKAIALVSNTNLLFPVYPVGK